MAGGVEEVAEGRNGSAEERNGSAEERNGSAGVRPDLERMELGNAEMNPTPVDPVQALPPGKFVKDAEEAVMEEEAAEDEKKKPVAPKASFFALFKFADAYDYLLMALAFFGAVGDGSSFAVMLAILGSLINSFGNHANGTSKAEFDHKVIQGTLALTYIAVGAFVCSFLEAACALRTADRQASKMRAKYLKATLRQDVGFFDTAGANVAEVVNSVGTDTLVVQDAIGEKIGNFVMNTSSFVSGFAVAFILEWRLAMVLVAFLPVLMIPGLLYGRALIGLARAMHAATNQAGSVAEENLSSIRTVYSFVGEQRTLTAYSKALDLTVKAGLKMGLAKGLATGANGVTFILWAVMAWYGSLLIMHRGLGGGTVLVCGLAAMMGGLGLGTALPNLRYIAEAQMAAHKMFTMIDRVPQIDSENTSGQTMEKVTGTLELRNVRFAYPSRPKQVIFEDFSLVIPTGKTVALVGSSGSGKSTVIALLERYYDPLGGAVLIDGTNIKDLQLKWLRTQIGLVSQEPSLFATTIKENILYGKDGASMEEITLAAKAANAHTFISALPQGYDTMVGEKGVQMSGGQKQRIAIARALLKNPPILLLDEATSALDSESERVVQVALDQAAVGRTTVVVAHRLSTIRTADLIAVVHGGRVQEIGSHQELLRNEDGAYSALVNIQNSRPEDDNLQAAADVAEESPSGPSSFQLRSSSSKRNSTSFRRDASVRRSLSVHSAGDAAKADETGGKVKAPSIGRLLKLNRPEWKQAILGSLGAAGFGFVQPLYAFTMGSMVSTFFEQNHDKMRREIRNFSLIFTALAIGCVFTNVTRDYNFASMGERLTKRVRELILTRVMTYEVAWFDEEEHSSSAVCSQLNTDAAVVRSLVGDRMSLLIQTGAALLLACIIGLVVAWPLAIVMIATQPITILCFYGKKVLLKRMSEGNLKSQSRSTLVASEAVSNHRTITAFHSQNKMLERFVATQDSLKRGARTRALIAGMGLGMAQFCMLGTWAFYFWYGAKLINEGKISFAGMFKVFFVLVSTGRMIADAGSATSDLSKGSKSAAAIFGILDRTSRIKAEEGSLSRVDGSVELKDVHFAYPMRPDVIVFKGFSLKVQAGHSIALVGQSGSGKSTIIGLIERFYDPLKGAIYIDGRDIKTLPLKTLRRHIGLVGQEPTLFSGTIRENILYGKEDASEAEVIEAAKAANAHTFICGLSNGYDTNTGERGLQLSGGQKQRVAIARAIIKNPAVLLLDEATSALDSQSEKIVQDALDRIMVGRTTIVVAHRLSTIQNANSIAVIQEGSIYEQGRHNELMARKGAYFELVKLQSKAH